VGVETAKERAMKIEGVPAGYEILRIGRADYLDTFLGDFGDVEVWDERESSRLQSFVILRKIQKPKTYRPFANAEEFKPHRDRWVKRKSCIVQVTSYSNEDLVVCNTPYTWLAAFQMLIFDDNTPFGVEVSE